MRILEAGYEPTEEDVIRSRVRTTGIVEIRYIIARIQALILLAQSAHIRYCMTGNRETNMGQTVLSASTISLITIAFMPLRLVFQHWSI